MKKLSDLLRIKPIPVHFEGGEIPELNNLHRVLPETDDQRSGEEFPETGQPVDEPMDVARKLWSSAGHF